MKENEKQNRLRRLRTHSLWLLLGIMAVWQGIFFTLSSWPIAQVYAMTAAGTIALAFQTRLLAKATFPNMGHRSFQFNLRILLIVVVPSAAIVVWILSWDGISDDAHTSATVKAFALIFFSPIATGAFYLVSAHNFRRETKAKTVPQDMRLE